MIDYYCKGCGEKVISKLSGYLVIPHFAHYPKSRCPYAAKDMERHDEMQQQILDYIKPLEAKTEVWVDNNRHRVDVLVEDRKLAIEVQHSPISISEWEQRTRDLNQVGYKVLWVWDSKRFGMIDRAFMEVRVPAEIRHCQYVSFGRVYILTPLGRLQAGHVDYRSKTIGFLKLTNAGRSGTNFRTSDNLELVKMGEPIFWKTAKEKRAEESRLYKVYTYNI